MNMKAKIFMAPNCASHASSCNCMLVWSPNYALFCKMPHTREVFRCVNQACQIEVLFNERTNDTNTVLYISERGGAGEPQLRIFMAAWSARQNVFSGGRNENHIVWSLAAGCWKAGQRKLPQVKMIETSGKACLQCGWGGKSENFNYALSQLARKSEEDHLSSMFSIWFWQLNLRRKTKACFDLIKPSTPTESLFYYYFGQLFK